jgi:hypothetical protein
MGTLGGECLGGGQADALASPGDDRHLALQIEVHGVRC